MIVDIARMLRPIVFLACCAQLLKPDVLWCQDQFGGQGRADSAHRLIVLAVQQGISSLPPTSAQSFEYAYDPDTLTFVASPHLGPTALLSTRTTGKGNFSLRLSGSYFELSDSFRPITYQVNALDPQGGIDESQSVFVKFGLDAKAKVGVVNVSASYGITRRIEAFVSFPITVVDAQASQSFTTKAELLDVPLEEALVSGATTADGLEAALQEGGLAFRKEKLSDLGFAFNDDTEVGLGRVTIGGKGVLYGGKRLRLAVAPQFFFPSPSEDEFAGSESPAILGRLLGEISILGPLKLHLDAGYDYDFDEAELRRFVTSGGPSLSFERASIDLGVSASLYDVPIRWTPTVAPGVSRENVPLVLRAVEDNKVGDDFVDFVFGTKFRVLEKTVVAGAVSVPLNDQGFRPEALGTLAIEQYF